MDIARRTDDRAAGCVGPTAAEYTGPAGAECASLAAADLDLEALLFHITAKEQELQVAAEWALEQVQRMAQMERAASAEIRALEFRLSETGRRNQLQAVELGGLTFQVETFQQQSADLEGRVEALTEALAAAYCELDRRHVLQPLTPEESLTAAASHSPRALPAVPAPAPTVRASPLHGMPDKELTPSPPPPSRRAPVLAAQTSPAKNDHNDLIRRLTKENFRLSAEVAVLSQQCRTRDATHAQLQAGLAHTRDLEATVCAQRALLAQQAATLKRCRLQVAEHVAAVVHTVNERDAQALAAAALLAEVELLRHENKALLVTQDTLETSYTSLMQAHAVIQAELATVCKLL